ncbi:unnamed protein product [Allacma fusca]|uniref:Uncharacterized protein n=1 Tax=Allacma fusca TaxID=39272 RepID=A0A8J2PHK1_9HEXA|nr:unnamed protein product [Allacma fusca]
MAFNPSTLAKIAALAFLSGIVIPRNIAVGEIRCPLVWEKYELSSGSAPDGSVPAYPNDEDNFVIRGTDSETQECRIGRFNILSGAYFVTKSGDNKLSLVRSLDDHRILRNVHGCTIRWVKNPNTDFLTRANTDNKNDNIVVGHITTGGESIIGEADSTSKELIYVTKEEQIRKTGDFEYLISLTDGFHLEFTNLTFQKPFYGSIEFLGIDEINNQGPGVISQAVTQTKDIIRATKFSHNRNWEHCSQATFNFEINLNLDVGPIKLNSLGQNIYQTFRKEKLVRGLIGSEVEQTLTTTRQIEVNPYAHIQACTLIGKINKFNNTFNAIGKYTAVGWTESGTFSGETYLNNVMVVLDPTINGGCLELVELFYRLNKIQTEGRKTGNVLKEEEKHIESRIAEILAKRPRN